MVEEAVFCADASDPDAAYGLPDAAGPATDLPLYDPSVETVPEEEKGEFARSLEAQVLARDPRMKRVRTAALRETVADRVPVPFPRGFAATRRESLCFGARGDGGRGGRRGADRVRVRRSPGRCAGSTPPRSPTRARTRALRMLGAVRPKTGEYAAVLENGAAAELLEVLIPSFLASQVAKGKSMLAGKVGRKVASGAVTVEDDPLDPGGFRRGAVRRGGDPDAAAGADREGGAARLPRGRVLGQEDRDRDRPAPAAVRGRKQPPTVGISNLRIAPGGHPPSALLKAAGDGILLTEFLGIHTADPVSGDFSVGASGIRIAGGTLAEPLHGFAVSGNILGLLEKVEAAGSDFRWFGNVGAPSLLVSAISVGGE